MFRLPPHVLLATLVFWGASMAPHRAHAENAADVAAARELYIEGARLSKEGQWQEAEDRLQRSLSLKRAAITHYALAVVQQNTGKLVESLENFRAFLALPAEPATDGLREPADRAVVELEGRVGKVMLHLEPAGVKDLDVRIDDVPVPAAALGLPRLVNPGRHVLTATADGYLPTTRSIEIAEGGTEEVSLELVPEPAPPPVVPEPAPPSSGPQSGSPAATQPVAPPEGPDRPKPSAAPAPPPERIVPLERGFPVGGAVLLAGGLLAIGTGITVGMLGVSEAKDAPTQDSPVADSARTKALAGDIVAGVGIGAATIGLIVLIVHAASDDEPSEDEVATGGAQPRWSFGPLADGVPGFGARF